MITNLAGDVRVVLVDSAEPRNMQACASCASSRCVEVRAVADSSWTVRGHFVDGKRSRHRR
jgi:hypothetical protein